MRTPHLAIASTLTASIAVLLAHGSAAQATPALAVGASPAVNLILALPLRNQSELETLVANQADRRSPLYHHFLTPVQFRAAYGPTAAQLETAASAMRAAGFSIAGVTSQGIKLHGNADAATRAFGVHLTPARSIAGKTRLVTHETINMPKALADMGATVIGLGDTPRKRVLSRVVDRPANRYSNSGAYWFTDLKQAYTYPSFRTGLTGKGVTIGIVIDSAVNPNDLKTYFMHEKYLYVSQGVPVPSIKIRPVLGGAETTSETDPYNPNGDGIEAALDMEQSLGSAPGAAGVIYDIPSLNDDAIVAGYIDVVEDNAVDVVSSSFGGCELQYSAAYNGGTDYTGILRTYHSVFLQGNSEGITWLASSGDNAGKECPSAPYVNRPHLPGVFIPSVSTPASDPNVTAVGGTNLVTTTPPASGKVSLTSKYVSENAYGDPEIPYDVYGYGSSVSGGIWGSGSGASAYYAKPAYQRLVETHNKNRTVPDVSMQMGGCPGGIALLGGPNQDCGYAPPLYDKFPRSYVAAYYTGPGTSPSGYVGLIGTSASSPEFAGLLAIKAQTMQSRLGNANGLIYALAAANDAFPEHFYHQGIPGYNGVVETWQYAHGYNPIVGVGTPYVQNFLGVPADPLSGDPQTFSNP